MAWKMWLGRWASQQIATLLLTPMRLERLLKRIGLGSVIAVELQVHYRRREIHQWTSRIDLSRDSETSLVITAFYRRGLREI